MITGNLFNEILGPQALNDFLPLVLYVFGIAIYGVVIWHFYRFISKRDIFHIELKEISNWKEGVLDFFEVIIYLGKYLLVFPLITFIAFAILATFLIFLSKSANVENILLVAMSIVAATRITAYYSENLSKDIAKMLPFALLGVFLVNPAFFDLTTTIQHFTTIPQYVYKIIQFGLFTIILEFGLRIGFSLIKILIPDLGEKK